MPRDGSQIYHRPPGTDGIPDTTIESTKYNINVADVEQDLNLPRPIIAGGTGANNSRDAMINLSGEVAGQQVDNYDSFPFVHGSFFSNSWATGSPVSGHYFSGVCHQVGPASATPAINMFLVARDYDDPLFGSYVREKHNDVWGAWSRQPGSQASLDAAYVNTAGDTMTGSLHINCSDPSVYLDATGGAPQIIGTQNGTPRWDAYFGIGANVDFQISRFNSSGVGVDTPLSIGGNTGQMYLTNKAIFNAGAQFSGDPNFQAAAIGADPHYTFATNRYIAYRTAIGRLLFVNNGYNALYLENDGRVVAAGSVMQVTGASQPCMSVYANTGVSFGLWTDGAYLISGQCDAQGVPYSPCSYFWMNGLHVTFADAAKSGGGPWNDVSDARIKNVLR